MASAAADGTVDDLLADARRLGHPVTARLITDWVARGRGCAGAGGRAGRGHGSTKAVYSAHQRELFAVLLAHRAQAGRTSPLTAIPIAIWVYWGDDYVPLRQARRALATWLDAHRQPPRHRAAQRSGSGAPASQRRRSQ